MVHNELHAIDLGIIAAYLIAMVTIGVVMVKRVREHRRLLPGRQIVWTSGADGNGLRDDHRRKRSDGARGCGVLERLQGDHDGAALSSRHVHLLRLCRADFRRRHDVRRFLHPRPFRAALRQERRRSSLGCADCFYDDGHGRLSGYGDGDNHQHARKRNRHLLSRWGQLLRAVVFIIYTATSGLFGVIYTDVFQFVMLILFVYIHHSRLVGLAKLGGMGEFPRRILRPELSTPYLDGGIVGDIITYFVFTLAGAEMWQRAFAAKSQQGRKGGTRSSVRSSMD